MEFTASQIAGILEGEVEGNPEIAVHKLARIEEGEKGSLTFLANPKYAHKIKRTRAAATRISPPPAWRSRWSGRRAASRRRRPPAGTRRGRLAPSSPYSAAFDSVTGTLDGNRVDAQPIPSPGEHTLGAGEVENVGSALNKALQELSTNGLLPAEWGGDTEIVRTSAMTGAGIDQLLETILITAELQEEKERPIKADPEWRKTTCPSLPM